MALWLIDPERDGSLELRRADGTFANYRLLSHGPDHPYRLELLAGPMSWVSQEIARLTAIPAQLTADQNAPNPFNAATRIRFGLPQPGPVGLAIFNVRGERVAELLRAAELAAGYHSVLWNGTTATGHPAATGIYFYQVTAGQQTLTRRMVLLK